MRYSKAKHNRFKNILASAVRNAKQKPKKPNKNGLVARFKV